MLISKKAQANLKAWDIKHINAMHTPETPHEIALSKLIHGLIDYKEAHEDSCDYDIMEDGVLHEGFVQIAKGIQILLNGKTGYLNCGTLDRLLRKLTRNEIDN